MGGQPSNREWFRRLLSGRPHQVIGGLADPYLLRWYLIPRNPVLNVYLHKFCRSDDPTPHDHPWWFVSLIVRGKYDEVTEHGTRRRGAGSIAFRPATWRHTVQLIRQGLPSAGQTWEVPCWTLIVTGRRARSWGFWCRRLIELAVDEVDELDRVIESTDGLVEVERFVPWQEFVDAGCGE